MADLPSGDRRGEPTRAIEGQQEKIAPSAESVCPSDDEQALSHHGGESHEVDAESHNGGGPSPRSDGESDAVVQAVPEPGADHRRDAATRRVRTAAARDAVAHARDVTATSRDQIAALHDRQLAARDAARVDSGRAITGADVVLRAAQTRRRAAIDRAGATEGRARAAADREHAALDREHAARDRLHAQADREALLRQLAIAETDALTGARTRAAGMGDLEHEIDRARRTNSTLVVAYIDVVGLKAVNDTHGHTAGDVLLQRVVQALRRHLRTYDLIVRLGGDEFLCAMSGATRNDARTRFRAIRAALAAEPDHSEIKVGFATLSPQDSVDALIQRADAELPITPRRSLQSVDRTGPE
jgi:diguanylate cyclase (GGDEF)-like protein